MKPHFQMRFHQMEQTTQTIPCHHLHQRQLPSLFRVICKTTECESPAFVKPLTCGFFAAINAKRNEAKDSKSCISRISSMWTVSGFDNPRAAEPPAFDEKSIH
jgi:hypothetical protein